MTSKQSRVPLWLTLCLALSILFFAANLFLGWDRSYWYDEVYTLGYANVGRPLDWALLKSDVHPPTYALLVRGLAGMFGLDPTGFALRLINLPALLAALWAFWLLREILGPQKLMLLAVLFMVNFYTLMLGLDLRSYALLLGFGLLAHTFYLREVWGLAPRHLALLLCCTLLTSLHFFGAAIGLSILLCSAYLGMRRGMPMAAVAVRLGLAAALTSAMLAWILVYSDVLDATGGNNWIRVGLDPWLDFVGWQGLAMVTGLISIVIRRSGGAEPVPVAAKLLMLPALLTLVVTVAISLHSPVISARNLSVVVPPFLLFVVLTVPPALFSKGLGLQKSVGSGIGVAGAIAVVVTALIGVRLTDSTTRNGQMIRWVLEEALTPECRDAPIFVKRPDQLDSVAQIAFTGAVSRPPVNYPQYDPALIPEACEVVGMGWHELGEIDEVVAFLTDRGAEVEAVLPPDPRLAARRLQTSGYVIIRTR
ncbi:MAG: hypothetical protein AAGB10_10035 [Pseudomonadota bacterium]